MNCDSPRREIENTCGRPRRDCFLKAKERITTQSAPRNYRRNSDEPEKFIRFEFLKTCAQLRFTMGNDKYTQNKSLDELEQAKAIQQSRDRREYEKKRDEMFTEPFLCISARDKYDEFKGTLERTNEIAEVMVNEIARNTEHITIIHDKFKGLHERVDRVDNATWLQNEKLNNFTKIHDDRTKYLEEKMEKKHTEAQDKYDVLGVEYESLSSEYERLKGEMEILKAKYEDSETSRTELASKYDQCKIKITNLMENNAKHIEDLNTIYSRLSLLENRVVDNIGINMGLTRTSEINGKMLKDSGVEYNDSNHHHPHRFIRIYEEFIAQFPALTSFQKASLFRQVVRYSGAEFWKNNSISVVSYDDLKQSFIDTFWSIQEQKKAIEFFRSKLGMKAKTIHEMVIELEGWCETLKNATKLDEEDLIQELCDKMPIWIINRISMDGVATADELVGKIKNVVAITGTERRQVERWNPYEKANGYKNESRNVNTQDSRDQRGEKYNRDQRNQYDSSNDQRKNTYGRENRTNNYNTHNNNKKNSEKIYTNNKTNVNNISIAKNDESSGAGQ